MATNKAAARKLGNDTLGRERREHLKSRINAVRTYRLPAAKEDPPSIAKARALVEAFDKRMQAQAELRINEAEKAKRLAHNTLLATDSFDEGLAIVKKFEALAKRNRWMEE